MPALIVDLDDTLVDTRGIAAMREARQWSKCVANLAKTAPFGEVREVLSELRVRGVSVGVVTRAVSFYAEAVLSHHALQYDTLVAYHDSPRQKPYPDPVIKCVQRLDATGLVVGVGDAASDAVAYVAAGIKAFGAGWSPYMNRSAGWDRILQDPRELNDLFS